MKRIIAMTAILTLAVGSSAFAKDMIMTKGVKVHGTKVTFKEVMANGKGYVAIHDTKNGKIVAPASMGHTAIKKGDNMNVTVTTDKKLKPGHAYIAMLHHESNNNGKYDFGPGSTKNDKPMMMNGKPVVKKFMAPKM